jgi:hypothetical protein
MNQLRVHHRCSSDESMLTVLAGVHSQPQVQEYANVRRSYWTQLVLTGMSRITVAKVPINT